jgi:hypothetical protein
LVAIAEDRRRGEVKIQAERGCKSRREAKRRRLRNPSRKLVLDGRGAPMSEAIVGHRGRHKEVFRRRRIPYKIDKIACCADRKDGVREEKLRPTSQVKPGQAYGRRKESKECSVKQTTSNIDFEYLARYSSPTV